MREELERMLRPGETLSEFVEASVLGAMERRRVDAEFGAQAEASWQDYRRTGASKPASEVLDRLQAKVDARRRQVLGP